MKSSPSRLSNASRIRLPWVATLVLLSFVAGLLGGMLPRLPQSKPIVNETTAVVIPPQKPVDRVHHPVQPVPISTPVSSPSSPLPIVVAEPTLVEATVPPPVVEAPVDTPAVEDEDVATQSPIPVFPQAPHDEGDGKDAAPTYRRATCGGTPWRIGVIQLLVPIHDDNAGRFHPDTPYRVVSEGGQVLYPTLAAIHNRSEPESTTQTKPPVTHLRFSWLCNNDAPQAIDVFYGDAKIVSGLRLDTPEPAENREEILAAWWSDYCQPASEPLNATAQQTKEFLLGMLVRRLRLELPTSTAPEKGDASALERHFERSVSLLLGFESVNAALGDEPWVAPRKASPLTEPLPAAPRIAAVPYPAVSTVALEKLASYAPDDCIYLHCRSLENYLWFRKLLESWGGSMQEPVSGRTHETLVRQRLERQLALELNENLQTNWQTTVTDLALVFGDPCFEEGAAVGVLLQAAPKQNIPLHGFLMAQRAQALREIPGASQQNAFAKDEVGLISTPGRQLQSYYAIRGETHFITNSRYLMQRFLQASQGKGSLAQLGEFRYARAKFPQADDDSLFLYLSDPFFSRLISPAYQVEKGRRAWARSELQQLELATLAAAAEGQHKTSSEELKAAGYLPPNFGERSDGTYALPGAPTIVDSARGAAGVFLPICDADVRLISAAEAAAYRRFIRNYALQWRRIDPVAVRIQHRPTPTGREDVFIDIAITPFATQKYAALQARLCSPGQNRIQPVGGDLLSIQAALKTKYGTTFRTYAGLHDAKLKFTIQEGRLLVDGQKSSQSYASKHWCLAIDSRDSECLNTLVELASALQIGDLKLNLSLAANTAISAVARNTARLPLLLVAPKRFWDPPASRRDGWNVLSPQTKLKTQPFSVEQPTDNMQARLQLKEVGKAQVAPYIDAYTYLEARRASAQNAALLDLMTQQFCLKAEQTPQVLERIYLTRLRCPLGGQYQPPDQTAGFTSDRWTKASLYDVDTIPSDYHFPLTTWLKTLDVGFALEPQTLRANAKLQVAP